MVSAILLQCLESHWKVRNRKNREHSFTADALLLDTTAVYAAKSERRKARAAERRPRDVQHLDLNTPLRVRLEKNDAKFAVWSPAKAPDPQNLLPIWLLGHGSLWSLSS
ncbi:hypothetical protein DFP73DRAFT_592854 [Morchella snyderi]|nr:hypothetical protein DFP73DRAFT_592854 [Morchella snyderi]